MNIKFIEKRDGKIDRFDPGRIRKAISKAASAIGESEDSINQIFSSTIDHLEKKEKERIGIREIEQAIIKAARFNGYENLAVAYQSYKDKREEARMVLSIAAESFEKNTTDKALLIESDSKEILEPWNRTRIVAQLEKEAGLSQEFAKDISKVVENIVVDMYQRGVRRFSTKDIRSIVDMVLKQEGLELQGLKQGLLGFSSADFESIVINRSKENSNVSSNNPEAVNLETAERIQKQYALEKIFSPDVTEAHLKGKIHIHDLGYPTRAYCSSHSLEYIKKYGLNKVLSNLESKSSSPNSAAVLNQHVQTFLASLQAHYAGALGFGFLNILYAPLLKRPVEILEINFNGKTVKMEKRDVEKLLEQGTIKKDELEIISTKTELRELPQREVLQIAQNLIFAASQNAFSRGGQTLFIDFNIHTGIPNYLKNVPAIGPRGKYMVLKKDDSVELIDEAPRFENKEDSNDPRNGDADSTKVDGKIVTYGDLEETAQRFAMALLEVWRRGDKNGRPFHFPKCDLHIDKYSLQEKTQKEVLDFAFKVTSENGSVYFMFDRGDDAVLAQCCRLKEKIEDKTMLKYPERLRFCGFQNVTINLAQASYVGKELKGTLEEIDKSMELALKAHNQKANFMQNLLDSDGSPMRSLGRPSDDGKPYIELKKATYILGVIGLNEAVENLTGNQLHESEAAYRLGLRIISHMYKRIQEFKKKTGLKFTLEETPGESTTRRFAKVDLKRFPEARKIIKGSSESPYYTNSIHFSPDADVGIVDRIIGQSKFHELIESGAIVHAYVGEERPNAEAIEHIVKQTLEQTRCSQLVFSPTYTECDLCGEVMPGSKDLCTQQTCQNSSEETKLKGTLFTVTRIVGYYSRVANWNDSQKQIFKDREKVEKYYAGKSGRKMDWLYSPGVNGKLIIKEFGKHGCPNCKILETTIKNKIKELKIQDLVDFKMYYLDELDERVLAEAALYDVPMDSVPTLVIGGKKKIWKKTTVYASNCQSGVCSVGGSGVKETILITPNEIESNILELINDYQK